MPFAGGSASDVVSRVLFNKMAAILGQPIVVENKPGAGGNLGTALAAKAAPDGYTLVGAASGPLAANLTLYKDLGYDPQEIVLISPFASFTIVVTASKKLGVTTVNDLIERAKKEPGALNYGSVGIGSSQHLAGEYFAQVAKVKLTHVPYRNIAQFGPDLIAGTVQLGFAWYPNVSRAADARWRCRARRRGRCPAAGAAEYADDGASGLAGIQVRRLVRPGRARRRAAGHPGTIERRTERSAERSRRTGPV